jgi:hypothetical protein
LNFYLYETSKALFVQRKCWYISRSATSSYTIDTRIDLVNHEILESSTHSYVLVK